jgi:hypothetical protein
MTEAEVRCIVRDELSKIAEARAKQDIELEESLADECWPAGMDNYGSLND